MISFAEEGSYLKTDVVTAEDNVPKVISVSICVFEIFPDVNNGTGTVSTRPLSSCLS